MLIQILTALVFGLPMATDVPELNENTLAKWRDYVQPTAEELQWRAIPWENSFWEAVVQARQDDKPILVWAMNGHPLGCT